MKQVTPLKAIRAKCIDCCAGQTSEIRNCGIEGCPLFTYRFGHNPKRKGIGIGISQTNHKTSIESVKTGIERASNIG